MITEIRMNFNSRGGDSRVRVWGAGGPAAREVAQAVVGGSADALGPGMASFIECLFESTKPWARFRS